MKFLLSWLLEHIQVDKKTIAISSLVEQLNSVIAEIDVVRHIQTDIHSMLAVRVLEQTVHELTVHSPELRMQITVEARKEKLETGSVILIKKEGGMYKRVMLSDLGADKEGVLPTLFIKGEHLKGDWRKECEAEEYVFVIDNKALTHRPDLWGHRGMAREIAACLDLQLVSEDHLLATKTIKHYDFEGTVSSSHPFELKITQNQLCGQPCRRLAGFYIPSIESRPSLLRMAFRLARVDTRPLDALIDMTNYVMYDTSQPMHVFDAAALPTKKIVGRCAFNGEKLTLLDGEAITLTSSDYVITDGEKPLALAGIMGGEETAVTPQTSEIFIEAASFEPAAIRKTAVRLKKRTEASTRFEKNLDPNQNTTALLRYLKLLDDAHIPYTATDAIISLGRLSVEKHIEIAHTLIESKLGIKVSNEQVEAILRKLGFGVELKNKSEILYCVTVPTFRGTKDVTLAEDIVEEVGRYVGYSTIPPIAPQRPMVPFDTTFIYRLRDIKQLLAYALKMREVSTYAFYNEEFLKTLHFDPLDALMIANPQSENWKRLITSLIPNLLQCVSSNAHNESLRFFECNRVWFLEEKPVETQECAGIWYEQKKSMDFYELKSELMLLFDYLHIPIIWKKPQAKMDIWYDAHKSAELWYKDRIMGRAGIMAASFLHNVVQGEAFIFELDAHVLLHEASDERRFRPLYKYPVTHLDISMLVPIECTVMLLEEKIRSADKHIVSVQLMDVFEKPEWHNKKSVTMRFVGYDDTGTLTKEAIDHIWNNVVKNVESIGAEIR